ncbi:MAG: O-antigen ligase family protein [Verrucomicrobia bacterium]|nr:MAG: O-antigen ligase family protein [Verrucomicrobiota bacterium]
MTALTYETVHYWALAVFSLAAAGIVCLWAVDGLVLGSIQISVDPLQWPLVGIIVLALIQLLPLRAAGNAGLALSLDPFSTRLFVVKLVSLLIYFAATLVFVDTPRRLRALVRTIIIFGFLLAMFGMTQSFTSDAGRVYWFRQLAQSTAFGPFINRHHFAGYMELTIALPLSLVFSGAIESYKRPLYAFAAAMMGIALIMTNSRGGMISLAAEILFLLLVASPRASRSKNKSRTERARAALLRAGLAFGLLVALILGALAFGGQDIFTRLLGTTVAADPTTGRTHFWSVTLDIIKAYPVAGSGLGSFSLIYTRYDSRNGMYRLEQAHNDYLQTLADGGIIAGLLGLSFLVILFRQGFARRETHDKFRRGVATGALAGCFAVLVHSFFDFTLHTTANSLLFLILAALATQDSRVNTTFGQRRRARPASGELKSADSAAPALPEASIG